MEVTIIKIRISSLITNTAKAILAFLAQKPTKNWKNWKNRKSAAVIFNTTDTIHDLQTPGRVLLAVLFIYLFKQDYTAKIPPYVPLLAVRFIGGLDINYDDYNDYNTLERNTK